MKIVIGLLAVLSLNAFASGSDGAYICPHKAAAEARQKQQMEQQARMPASNHTQPMHQNNFQHNPDANRLLQLDVERGCCNNRGGFSECKNGILQCRDGSASSCGC